MIEEQSFTVSAGDVFQMFEHGKYSNATVLGIAPANEWGTVYVKMARPYCFASGVGTTGPTPLVGVEVYTVDIASLEKLRRIGEHMCT